MILINLVQKFTKNVSTFFLLAVLFVSASALADPITWRSMVWVSPGAAGSAIVIGSEKSNLSYPNQYMCRANIGNGNIIIGKTSYGLRGCDYNFNNQEKNGYSFDIVNAFDPSFIWVPNTSAGNNLSAVSVQGGTVGGTTPLYPCVAFVQSLGTFIPGYTTSSSGFCYYGYGGAQQAANFFVLVPASLQIPTYTYASPSCAYPGFATGQTNVYSFANIGISSNYCYDTTRGNATTRNQEAVVFNCIKPNGVPSPGLSAPPANGIYLQVGNGNHACAYPSYPGSNPTWSCPQGTSVQSQFNPLVMNQPLCK